MLLKLIRIYDSYRSVSFLNYQGGLLSITSHFSTAIKVIWNAVTVLFLHAHNPLRATIFFLFSSASSSTAFVFTATTGKSVRSPRILADLLQEISYLPARARASLYGRAGSMQTNIIDSWKVSTGRFYWFIMWFSPVLVACKPADSPMLMKEIRMWMFLNVNFIYFLSCFFIEKFNFFVVWLFFRLCAGVPIATMIFKLFLLLCKYWKEYGFVIIYVNMKKGLWIDFFF